MIFRHYLQWDMPTLSPRPSKFIRTARICHCAPDCAWAIFVTDWTQKANLHITPSVKMKLSFAKYKITHILKVARGNNIKSSACKVQSTCCSHSQVGSLPNQKYKCGCNQLQNVQFLLKYGPVKVKVTVAATAGDSRQVYTSTRQCEVQTNL